MSNELRGILYGIAAGLFFGSIGYFGIKTLQGGMSISNMLFWRFTIAGLIITIIALLTLKKPLHSELLKPFLYCALFYSSSTSLYFLSSTYIGTSLAVAILFTFPAFVILLSRLLYKSRIKKLHHASCVFILVGLGLLSYDSDITIDLYGIFLSLISALFYAIYIVASKKQTRSAHPILLTLMVCYGCSFTFLCVSLFQGTLSIPQDFNIWIHMLGFAIVCTVLPILCTLYSLKYISASKTSILAVLEPVFVVIIGVMFLEEVISMQQIIGIGIILVSAVLVQLDTMKAFK